VVARVLIGEFGAIFRAGLADLLVEAGCDVLPDDGGRQGVVERVVASHPGVVVLDLDAPGSEHLARTLSSTFPEVTVIACSSAAVRMRVYPPFHSGESYVSHLSPDLLVRASTGTGPQAKERRCPPT
jgi:DNA-binding NarL/FixJ family response regulator